MPEWSYFRWLAVGLGAGMVVEGLVLQALSERSRRILSDLVAPPEGPVPWVLGISVLYLVWLGDLWRRVVTDPIPHGWVLAGILSGGIVKLWAYVLRYQGFRRWVHLALTDPRRLRGLCLFLLLLGPALVLLGVTLY